MKAKFTGLKAIEVFEPIEEDTDYLVSIRCAADGSFLRSKKEPESEVFHLKALNIEQLLKIGNSTPLKLGKTYSKSKVLRFAIEDWAKRKGETDTETFYEKVMNNFIDVVNKKDS